MMQTTQTHGALVRSVLRAWRWLRLWWALEAPVALPKTAPMATEKPPSTTVSWNHYEVLCWLRAYRERGLHFNSLPDDMKPAIYEIICHEAAGRLKAIVANRPQPFQESAAARFLNQGEGI